MINAFKLSCLGLHKQDHGLFLEIIFWCDVMHGKTLVLSTTWPARRSWIWELSSKSLHSETYLTVHWLPEFSLRVCMGEVSNALWLARHFIVPFWLMEIMLVELPPRQVAWIWPVTLLVLFQVWPKGPSRGQTLKPSIAWPLQQNLFVQTSDWDKSDTECSVGIYGTFLKRKNLLYMNLQAGTSLKIRSRFWYTFSWASGIK